MTAPAPSPAPAKRSRRMVVWLVAVPIVILLLALAGANWKFFHLAYAKHLMGSDDPDRQERGIKMVTYTHIPLGMSLEEVRALLAPIRPTELDGPTGSPRRFTVPVKDDQGRFIVYLVFDEVDRLSTIYTGDYP